MFPILVFNPFKDTYHKLLGTALKIAEAVLTPPMVSTALT